MQDHTLEQLRTQIDQVNDELMALISKRAAIAAQVGRVKQGTAVYQPAREAQVLAQVAAKNNGPLSDSAMTAIFREIIAACRNLQQPLRVAYLGPAGTYSEEAARRHSGSTSQFVSCGSIDETLEAVEGGEADIAVIPLENSTEGPVNHTLDLLLQTSLTICGEVVLPIHHQLLSRAESTKAITEVMAHPQALAQCSKWLDKHLPYAKRSPASSNAEAARLAAEQPALAAIAGTAAAELYQLPILAKDIEDEHRNTTRFVVLGNDAVPPTGSDKTSLVFSTPNEPGALYHILGILTKRGINMNKIASRPIASQLWEYVFYIDVDGHQADITVAAALKEIKQATSLCKVLGSYPKAS